MVNFLALSRRIFFIRYVTYVICGHFPLEKLSVAVTIFLFQWRIRSRVKTFFLLMLLLLKKDNMSLWVFSIAAKAETLSLGWTYTLKWNTHHSVLGLNHFIFLKTNFLARAKFEPKTNIIPVQRYNHHADENQRSNIRINISPTYQNLSSFFNK